jgi:hypothetical protein
VVVVWLRFGPGGRLVQGELGAVLGRPSGGPRWPGWLGQAQNAVGADPAEQLEGQIGQHERQPGDVLAGVHDDQVVRATIVPMPGGDQPADDVAELLGGHRGGIVGRPRTDSTAVQDVRPGASAATKEYG